MIKKPLMAGVALLCCIAVFFVWYGIFVPREKDSTTEVIFRIGKGEGGREIANNLANQRLIRSAVLFQTYTVTKGMSRKLQAGAYRVSPSMTVPEIANKFASGDIIKDQITIIEGWSVKDIARHLEELGKFKAHEVIAKLGEREGYLFPDTYEVRQDMSVSELGAKIWQNFEEKFTLELRQELLNQDKTIHEVITMASLVEKEVQTFEDKKMVSGILWKRLKNDIPLQVDATISYITGGKTIQITAKEKEIDSPYNTYKYKGLPPSPIANPGMESIMAAIYPEQSPYWYYLSTPDGQTIFSKNFEEHKAAKAMYLQ